MVPPAKTVHQVGSKEQAKPRRWEGRQQSRAADQVHTVPQTVTCTCPWDRSQSLRECGGLALYLYLRQALRAQPQTTP